MIIQSVRLKNVKSYAEGADGDGISVSFQSGVNRVAGRNGNGKTTIIEALGYALFFAEPDFEERFSVPVYLLRAGQDEGEIDVVFEHHRQAYRIERGLGRSRRKSKVVQLCDNSTCAEGDDAVARWLCRLLASEKHRFTEPSQLSSLFSNLIGVRQGQLTRPFDSKQNAAREFFEPLLDVAIFRECNSRLGDAQSRFKTILEDRNISLAKIEARIHERVDSPRTAELKEAELEVLAKRLEKSRRRKENADKLKQTVEQKHEAFESARRGLDQAKAQLELARQRREADQLRVTESQEATALVQTSEPGFQAYAQAEARLRELHQQNIEKQTLQQQRAEADRIRTEAEGKKTAAQAQLDDYKSSREQKILQAEHFRQQVALSAKHLEETKAQFEHVAQATEAARRAWDWLEHWLANVSQQANESSVLLEQILAEEKKARQWDSQLVLNARAEEQRLAQLVTHGHHTLAVAEQAKQTLNTQLAQIRDGVCPFLKEHCRQFDARAIQSDLAEREKELVEINRQHQGAIASHKAANQTLERLNQEAAAVESARASINAKIREVVNRYSSFSPAVAEKHFSLVQSYLGYSSSLPLTCPPSSVTSTNELCQFVEAEKRSLKIISDLFGQIAPQLNQQFAQFETQRRKRVEEERDLEHGRRQLNQIEIDLHELTKKVEQLNRDASKATAEVVASTSRVGEVDAKLKAFVNLDTQFREQQHSKDQHIESHRQYLGAKPLAGKLDERRRTLEKSLELEVFALEQTRHSTERLQLASADFQPAALEQARNEAAEAGAKLAINERDFKAAQAELKQARERLKQWKEACAQREKLHEEINRLKAAANLARLAGKILKDSAPVVAQHLCTTIADKAQRIFNQINPDPIRLEWRAEPQYSLRIIPGERRFAMLSGGEQTKLALAMTLAMIEQFSGLRFAVFDEPTYGVDPDSRQKLADAIIQAQTAAGLDQLIVVSHDNAFEGKIEHVVLLNKTSGRTEVAG